MPRLLGLLALCLALVGAMAACGDDDSEDASTGTDTTESTDGTTSSTAPEGSTTTDTEPEPAEAANLSVYFLDADEKLRVGHVREIEAVGVAQATLESLFAGPTPEDEALGLSSTVPDGTTVRSIDVAGGTAAVDLSAEFESGGGSLSMQARLAQVVYTLTQFPTVDEVELLIEGVPVEALGGEGVLIDGPLTRADFQFGGTYEVLEPMILIETPRPGEVVEGDVVHVGGSSNTFEAALYFEVLDDSGEVVVPETYAMASSGSGTTGTFLVPIDLPPDLSGELTIRAYDLSAEDGSRVGVTEVPFQRG